MTYTKKAKQFISENKGDLIQIGVLVAVAAMPHLLDPTLAEAAKSGSGDVKAGSLPWSTGINTLFEELNGPLPKIAGVTAMAISGSMLAFGETNGLLKRALQATFGLGIAINAPGLVGALTGTDVAGCMF